MGIALDAVASGVSATGTTSLTYNHTVGAGLTNGALTVTVGYYMRSASVTSMTYGGVAMTLRTRYENGAANATQEVWYLAAPASGTASVVINVSVTLTNVQAYAQSASFSGVDQTTVVEITTTSSVTTGSHSTQTDALTPATDGDWVIDTILHGASALATAGAATTLIVSINTANSVGKGMAYAGPVSPPASTSMTWAFGSSSTASNHIVFALKAAAGGGAPKFLPEALGLASLHAHGMN
jgi:hypothetical protein